MRKTTITFNAVITACEKAARWQARACLFAELTQPCLSHHPECSDNFINCWTTSHNTRVFTSIAQECFFSHRKTYILSMSGPKSVLNPSSTCLVPSLHVFARWRWSYFHLHSQMWSVAALPLAPARRGPAGARPVEILYAAEVFQCYGTLLIIQIYSDILHSPDFILVTQSLF